MKSPYSSSSGSSVSEPGGVRRLYRARAGFASRIARRPDRQTVGAGRLVDRPRILEARRGVKSNRDASPRRPGPASRAGERVGRSDVGGWVMQARWRRAWVVAGLLALAGGTPGRGDD